MLSKTEKTVLSAVYDRCNDGKCLVGAASLYDDLEERKKIPEHKTQEVLRALELDDYLDVIHTDRHGEPLLCVTLHKKGRCFMREAVENRRTIYFKISLAAVSAVVTFFIGRLLYLLFK